MSAFVVSKKNIAIVYKGLQDLKKIVGIKSEIEHFEHLMEKRFNKNYGSMPCSEADNNFMNDMYYLNFENVNYYYDTDAFYEPWYFICHLENVDYHITGAYHTYFIGERSYRIYDIDNRYFQFIKSLECYIYNSEDYSTDCLEYEIIKQLILIKDLAIKFYFTNSVEYQEAEWR